MASAGWWNCSLPLSRGSYPYPHVLAVLVCKERFFLSPSTIVEFVSIHKCKEGWSSLLEDEKLKRAWQTKPENMNQNDCKRLNYKSTTFSSLQCCLRVSKNEKLVNCVCPSWSYLLPILALLACRKRFGLSPSTMVGLFLCRVISRVRHTTNLAINGDQTSENIPKCL